MSDEISPEQMLAAYFTETKLMTRRWCERTVQVMEEEVVNPRREEEVLCASLYQYNLEGWRVDQDRMRNVHGGDDGIANYYSEKGPAAMCFIYKPPDMRPTVLNRTVWACCDGWSGPSCTEGVGLMGRCFSTWNCQDFPGTNNASLMTMEECCTNQWGHSWKNVSSDFCFSCSYSILTGDFFSPFLLKPYASTALMSSVRNYRFFATCVTWSGFHYRSFDGKHFNFNGGCTYNLASSLDGTWAIYISTELCSNTEKCPKTLRMMFGLDLVVAQNGIVLVNGARVPNGQPYVQNGVSVRWLGDFVFVESGLGIRVKHNGEEIVYVTVNADLKGSTRGLCGVYNDDPSDDFTTIGGTVSQFAASFGNSWKVPDINSQSCNDVAELGHSCDITEDGSLRKLAEGVCHRLLAGPFSQCHGKVDPGGYYDTCMYIYCSQAGSDDRRQAAVCDTFASYVRECAQQHIFISWRRSGFCEKNCGNNKVYSDCISSCPVSCTAVGTSEEGHCRDECVSGCECPSGYYVERGFCMREEECPCYHRRQKYLPGQTIKQKCNQCICKGGRWHCSQDKCAAECHVVGDPHYITFDHKRYSFHGTCGYTLVEDFVDKKLLITAENVDCGSQGAVSCLRAITLTVYETTVKLRTTGDVTVNGQDVTLPFTSADLSVQRASSSFLLVQTFGVYIFWGLEFTAAYITVQPVFANKVRGLCGTYNWNQNDDFTTREGDIETNIAAFANKFRTSVDCLPVNSLTFDPCGTYAQQRQFAENMCAIIRSPVFESCHDLVDRDPYYQFCLYDVCGCAVNKNCLCSAVALYARECAQEGAHISWRNRTFCSVQCSGGQVYSECSRPCDNSCADLRGVNGCEAIESCVAGCNCPEDLVLDDSGQCIQASMCPCIQGESVYQPGSTVQRNCNKCTCENGLWNCTQNSCPEATYCPQNLVYAFRSCLQTCDTLGQNHTCLELYDGCVCPEGTVLLGDHCVPPSECPCLHNGKLYYHNDTIEKDCNTCVCKNRQWLCSKSYCTGTCIATGDPHYITFDGKAYTFLGDCEYVLVRESSGLFTITIENVPCGTSSVTCTKSVIVGLGNTIIHMLRGKGVTVNGAAIKLPKTYNGNGLILERAGLFLILISRLGVTVLWDGGTRVYVKLDPKFQGRVGGLCGNFDGDTENEFTTRQGIVESTSDLFGNSWRVNQACPEVQNEEFHPCTENPHRATWARRQCNVITQSLFASCHEEVPCQQFYDWCVFDACGCDSGGDCECLCTAIAAYAEECNRRGLYIRWRTQDLCPMQCDNGLVYEACGPVCPQTCDNLGEEPLLHCGAISCVEGCFCPEGMVMQGDSCVDASECQCTWDNTSFLPGTVVTQDCRNCTCHSGRWRCFGEPCGPSPHCLDTEFSCSSGRCIPSVWVCDNEEDCGDGSDEFCVPTCGPHEFQCLNGQCILQSYRCDGQTDCTDYSDEKECPVLNCTEEEFRCANGRCVPQTHVCDGDLDCGFADDSDEKGCEPACGEAEFRCSVGKCVLYIHRCDGHDDCGDYSDERSCTCGHGEFQCPERRCLNRELVCDGTADCHSGIDELVCQAPGRSCSEYDFQCGSGECKPRGWVCDNEADCLDGSDEFDCNRTCHLDEFKCQTSEECIHYRQLCDGIPHCLDQSDESLDNCDRGLSTTVPPRVKNATIRICPEFSCSNGKCVTFNQVCNGMADCSDGAEARGLLPSDEEGCGSWSPWGQWSECSRSCGAGAQTRLRSCTSQPEDVLRHCQGEESQTQQCFTVACPVDGEWSEWTSWSNCTRNCSGVVIRRRECIPPQNGGRHCSALPGSTSVTLDIKPCLLEGCPNVTSCPGDLVTRDCAPCPLTCSDLTNKANCEEDMPCISGCWCPKGLVLDSDHRCVHPEDCPCEAEGVKYWPGQLVKVNCQICTCQKGRLEQCRQSPECSVNCGWSSWSSWGDCLGPCGVQSVQWSFRSPNNPTKHGNGKQCRGIYRKARRCQTNPCEMCKHLEEARVIGERWRVGDCQVCQCLRSLNVQCSAYCPYSTVGCPKGQILVEGSGNACCYCTDGGVNGTAVPAPIVLPLHTVTPEPEVYTRSPLVTHPLPAGDNCYQPLGLNQLPNSSFTASSQQPKNPAHAGRLNYVIPNWDLQGWSPDPEEYHEMLSKPPYLQIDLLKSRNLTGAVVQGAGSFDTFITSFHMQFSDDGGRWHDYQQLFQGNVDDSSPAVEKFDRMITARYVRVLPHDFSNGIYLRTELLGCGEGQNLPQKELKHTSQHLHSLPLTFGSSQDPGKELQKDYPEVVQHSKRFLKLRLEDFLKHPCLNQEVILLIIATNLINLSGPCSFALGLEDGRIRYQQLEASSYKESNPPDAGRLNIVPNILNMEPGWSPLLSDQSPYFQVDFLQPTFVSGVITQGGSRPGEHITKYRLAYSSDGLTFHNYTDGRRGSQHAKIFEANFDNNTPVKRVLKRLILTRFLRIFPVEYHKYIYLRIEILGCPGTTVFPSQSPSYTTPAQRYISQWPATSSTSHVTLQEVTSQRMVLTKTGAAKATHCQLGQFECRSGECVNVSTSLCNGKAECSDSSDEEGCVTSTTAWESLPPFPRILCTQGQFQCEVLGCIDAIFVCDGQMDCLDGSDEKHCGEIWISSGNPTPLPLPTPVPSPCSAKQFSCASGECIHLEKRCDLHQDCQDGSDEINCVDCILSPWTSWSDCSHTCGLGVIFRQREVLRHALPEGECDEANFDSRSCFIQACPVNGLWSEWSDWSECDAKCNGGVRIKKRSCTDPPPKNGGHDCLGDAVQTELCNLQPCGDSQECGPEMIYVAATECEKNSLPPCPLSCKDLNSQTNCSSSCIEGCRCPSGLYLQEGHCINVSECYCYYSAKVRQPAEIFIKDNCSQCVCQDGIISCDESSCPVDCSWSAWSPWTPCDKSCGVGVQQRYRSPSNPPATNGGSPCVGDTVDVQECQSSCSPVAGGWSFWSPWSTCTSSCDSGVQTRNRTCTNPGPVYGGADCPGPHIQTRDCNTQPCQEACPKNMVYRSAEECHSSGGACPRVCIDLMANVECTTACYDGCYCDEVLFLQNDSCVPLNECMCYHLGKLYEPGETVSWDRCNNCTCAFGEMTCGTEPCPVDCGWSGWTQWSTCSKTCDVGARRRYRAGTNPPAALGGRQCEGFAMDLEFCSMQPCKGSWSNWGPWSECSVPCGGGYKNRTRISVFSRNSEFATCNIHRCGAHMQSCPKGKVWKACADGPVTCMDLSLKALNTTCEPGCYCPKETVLQNDECVPVSDCPCAENGVIYSPGETVLRDCNNCSCVSGQISNCTEVICDVNGDWSAWTPWSECSASCGTGLQSRYRFCTDPPPSGNGLPCIGPEREGQPCNMQTCSRSGNWSEWSPWTDCTRTCGEGVRTRNRLCDNPPPSKGGDYCEGPSTESQSCHMEQCPGLSFFPILCIWSCEPGCYCTSGKVLNENGTACVERQDCRCLDLQTGERYLPGETVPRGDGCNNCTCMKGKLVCTNTPCIVPGGWCEWSEWTPCSKTCGYEMISRYRTCSCPKPQNGGESCVGIEKYYGETGVQLERKQCPSVSFCPVDGGWSSWGLWSPCSGCSGASVRMRECTNPPARFGGLPCEGETKQSRGCHDNTTVCSDCGGGQVHFECGKPCPRSCDDLHISTVCLDSSECQPSCGCLTGQVLQDGVCIEPAECRCKYQNSTLGIPEAENRTSAWTDRASWEYIEPGETVQAPCLNCTCETGHLNCTSDPLCRLNGGWSSWSQWTPCSQSCRGGTRYRFRDCNNPAPQNGGKGCLGISQQQRECNLQGCDESKVWSEWSPWSACTVTCGGGEQMRTRTCLQLECQGLPVQSKACNTQVCFEVGCPVDRLYRECLNGEGCPYSCAHLNNRMDCFTDGCEEGCHCPVDMYLHNGSCVKDCPCILDRETLQQFQNHSTNSSESPVVLSGVRKVISLGDEILPGDGAYHNCSYCTCQHGQLNCTFHLCPVDGGMSLWSTWSTCSLSCGGLGQMTRSRSCTNPAPANGGKGCSGPTAEIKYCQTPECEKSSGPTVEPTSSSPDSGEGYGAWTSWTPCSKSCSDPEYPAIKTRSRFCMPGMNCTGEPFQEKVCNLPQCTDEAECRWGNCSSRNCSWNPWSEWSECSRSCGVGRQQRIRTYNPPGPDGVWCEDTLTGNMDIRFCNIQACIVDGGWSRWSPWSRCDRTCGGGKSVRTRSCSSPPPKNGGKNCRGKKYQVKLCNPKPCGNESCPPSMEYVNCANRCPRHCTDYQRGIACIDSDPCEPGCRCPEGFLEQDGGCVLPWQCECTDAQGLNWAPGSSRQDDCNNCTCSDGQIICTNDTCPTAECSWSRWSAWSQCSVTCDRGVQTRFRSSTSGSSDRKCLEDQSQTKHCYQGICPPLCLHDNLEYHFADTWLVGECQQCLCTPEGTYCLDIDCKVDGTWTPWSPWSDCPVTCGQGTQIRNRACINPPPRNNGSDCEGPETEAQNCSTLPCPVDGGWCEWSDWTPCSQSCGPGIVTRRRNCSCLLLESGGAVCSDSESIEMQHCYNQPCPEDCSWSPWSDWTNCSCNSVLQYRYRIQQGPNHGGKPCEGPESESRICDLRECEKANCDIPFEYRDCGSPCGALCSSFQQKEECENSTLCVPGCYCPEGLLEFNGTCVPLSECGCLHLIQSEDGNSTTPVYLLSNDTLTLDCKHCVCWEGELQCTSESCEGAITMSEWSEWTPCTPCLPLSALSPRTVSLLMLQSVDSDNDTVLPSNALLLASVQRRYRSCLDVETGLPVSEDLPQCIGELVEEKLCPHIRLCEDLCLWSEWSPWSPCRAPCSGGFRVRKRYVLHPEGGQKCQGPRFQSESCNTAVCPGEHCDDRGKVYSITCANQCPRTCADLWEHVECLQGACRPGCRCPDGWLLQDNKCVPISQCRCGLPSTNVTQEYNPGEMAQVDCNNCTCGNGSFGCTDFKCPVYGPWSEWSECSATCGGGHMTRNRTCEDIADGLSCAGEAVQMKECSTHPCPVDCVVSKWSEWSECSSTCGGGVATKNRTIAAPAEHGGEPCPLLLRLQKPCNTQNCTPECPGNQISSSCANACPHSCTDLQTGAKCLQDDCELGCACPSDQVLQDGVCVSPQECPCSLIASTIPWLISLTTEDRLKIYPAGAVIYHECNSCICQNGTFNCSEDNCNVDCAWSEWSPWSPCSVTCGSGVQTSARYQTQQRMYEGKECIGPSSRKQPCTLSDCECPPGEKWRKAPSENELCERTCQEIYEDTKRNCSVGEMEGCVCEAGRYRNSTDRCVTAAHCECLVGGRVYQPGTEWQEGCATCHCLNGMKICIAECPPLHCIEGEIKVEEPGSCCPVCRKETIGKYAVLIILKGIDKADTDRFTLVRDSKTRAHSLKIRKLGINREFRQNPFFNVILNFLCYITLTFFYQELRDFDLLSSSGESSSVCRLYTEVRNITKGSCHLDNVEVSYCSGRCLSRTNVTPEEPFLQTLCDCCSYHLDPTNPVRFLRLQCENGETEQVVLPVIHSCKCSSCQGGDFSKR
nr:PREDICTED: SCO-spondin [Latimeria chalumnae]|eukprot:XP_014342845.1 PREDICTED: SCO-spondin [Latimeria chalumnae]